MDPDETTDEVDHLVMNEMHQEMVDLHREMTTDEVPVRDGHPDQEEEQPG